MQTTLNKRAGPVVVAGGKHGTFPMPMTVALPGLRALFRLYQKKIRGGVKIKSLNTPILVSTRVRNPPAPSKTHSLSEGET